MWHIGRSELRITSGLQRVQGHCWTLKKSGCSVMSGLPWVQKKLFLVITFTTGEAPNLNSWRERSKFLVSPQVLSSRQLSSHATVAHCGEPGSEPIHGQGAPGGSPADRRVWVEVCPGVSQEWKR